MDGQQKDATGNLYEAAVALRAKVGPFKAIAMLLKIADEMLREAALEKASFFQDNSDRG